MARVFLGLGCNLGDRERHLKDGLRLLEESITITRVSSVYETEPWGYAEQSLFLNLACEGKSALLPRALLAACQRVERQVGRAPTFRNGPRVLDVDILVYGQRVIVEADLVVPHARLAERAFVLVPLAEIAPRWRHPVLHRTASQLLQAAPGRAGVRLWRPAGNWAVRGSSL